MENNFDTKVKDLIEKHTGKRPMAGTDECIAFHATDKPDEDCPSHLECIKMAAILALTQASGDAMKKDGVMGLVASVMMGREMLPKIYAAKSVEEIDKLFENDEKTK